ncbi:MAG TPA: hypothetical protein VHB21_23155 [Minicystis sp.]|nr:hypothetical protein [Minicystis sp.]
MLRAYSALLAASLLGGLSWLASCDANVTEGCVSGPCTDDAGLVTTSASTGSSAGGGGGAPDGGTGGAPSCFADWHKSDACDVKSLPKTGDIPCNVWAVMHKNPIDSGGCQKCHQNPPLNGAPFPELRYEDLLAVSGYGIDNPDERVFQSMARAISDVPPMFYTHMPFAGSQPLTCDDAKTLSKWLTDCIPPAPEGTGDEHCCQLQMDPMDVDAGCP